MKADEPRPRPSPGLIWCVMTTIQAPTPSAIELSRQLAALGARWIVVGDRKGPASFNLPGADLLELSHQKELKLRLAPLLPVNHYVRKNLGYLVAIARGAAAIYETDDDNCPNDQWQMRSLRTRAVPVGGQPWVNVFRFFSDRPLWPRGFPLRLGRQAWEANAHHHPTADAESFGAPIQQPLVDGAPDVDAVYRLFWESEGKFDPRPSVRIEPGCWCPFNSQNCWWFPPAYELLYLPSTCTFRMTDIWRSFVAQRCLWEMGYGVVFHSADVVQDRNPHDVMKDFADEVPGYLNNERIVKILGDLALQPGAHNVGRNLISCYEALVKVNLLAPAELDMVHAWIQDLEAIRGGMTL